MKIIFEIVNDSLIKLIMNAYTVNIDLLPKESMSEVLEKIDSKINFDKIKEITINSSFTSYTTERNFTAVMNTISQIKKIKLIRGGFKARYILPVYSGGANVTIKR